MWDSRPESCSPALATLVFQWIGASPDDFVPANHALTGFISNPDFFSFFVAFVAGVAGILSLTNAKSGALIGVLISVTTIPAASNIGVAAAYGDWHEAGGAAASSRSTSPRSCSPACSRCSSSAATTWRAGGST